MSVFRLPAFVSMLLLFWASAAQADFDEARAYTLAVSCSGCHGTDGNSPGSIPPLQGKSKEFIVTAMQEFKTGASQGTVMNRLARGYTDEEIELIGKWFAAMAQER